MRHTSLVSIQGGSVVLGWLTFSAQPDSSFRGNVSWIKNNIGSGIYPAGFINESTLVGSTLTTSLPFNDAVLNFTGGDLVNPLTTPIRIDGLKLLSANNNKTIGSIRMGLFKGRVIDPETLAPISFSGVVMQQQTNGAGYFIGTSRSGNVTLQKAE